jgi:ferredoxin
MTWVITKLCIDCLDSSCVKVCPVDCIYELKTEDEKYRKQLFIHPEECINCGACEPECPWNAIYEESEVPEIFQEDIQINAQVFKDHTTDEFTTNVTPIKQKPTPEDVEENKKKWGFS